MALRAKVLALRAKVLALRAKWMALRALCWPCGPRYWPFGPRYWPFGPGYWPFGPRYWPFGPCIGPAGQGVGPTGQGLRRHCTVEGVKVVVLPCTHSSGTVEWVKVVVFRCTHCLWYVQYVKLVVLRCTHSIWYSGRGGSSDFAVYTLFRKVVFAVGRLWGPRRARDRSWGQFTYQGGGPSLQVRPFAQVWAPVDITVHQQHVRSMSGPKKRNLRKIIFFFAFSLISRQPLVRST